MVAGIGSCTSLFFIVNIDEAYLVKESSRYKDYHLFIIFIIALYKKIYKSVFFQNINIIYQIS